MLRSSEGAGVSVGARPGRRVGLGCRKSKPRLLRPVSSRHSRSVCPPETARSSTKQNHTHTPLPECGVGRAASSATHIARVSSIALVRWCENGERKRSASGGGGDDDSARQPAGGTDRTEADRTTGGISSSSSSNNSTEQSPSEQVLRWCFSDKLVAVSVP